MLVVLAHYDLLLFIKNICLSRTLQINGFSKVRLSRTVQFQHNKKNPDLNPADILLFKLA